MTPLLATALDRARRLLAWRWLPLIVNGGVLLLVALAVGNQAWALFRPAEKPAAAPPPPRGVQVDIQPLMATQMFGVSRRGGPGGGSAPLSSLNVALAGVIPMAGGGYAMISVNGMPQETYTVGQELVPGAVLRAVQADRVLVERSGMMETLMLQEAGAAADTAVAAVPVPGAAPAAAPAAFQPGVTPPGQGQPAATRAFNPEQLRQQREERKRQRDERRQQRNSKETREKRG